MKIDLQKLESFFGGKFVELQDGLWELLFSTETTSFRLWVNQNESELFFTADPAGKHAPSPLVEIGTKCDRVQYTEATGIGPVALFCYEDELRFSITRTSEGNFSICPNWDRDTEAIRKILKHSAPS